MMTSATLSWGMSTREPMAATKKGSEAAGSRGVWAGRGGGECAGSRVSASGSSRR